MVKFLLFLGLIALAAANNLRYIENWAKCYGSYDDKVKALPFNCFNSHGQLRRRSTVYFKESLTSVCSDFNEEKLLKNLGVETQLYEGS